VRIEAARRREVRALACDQHDEQPARECKGRGHHQGQPPLVSEDGGHQVRHGLAERQRADQHAEGQAALRDEPAGGHLHRRRVDGSQGDSGQEAKADGGPRARRDQHGGICQRTADGARTHQLASLDEIRDVDQRRDQRTNDEAALHRHGEPCALDGGHLQLACERGRHSSGGEPQGHPQELREGDDDELAPGARRGVCIVG
jgi:hypothetical protein